MPTDDGDSADDGDEAAPPEGRPLPKWLQRRLGTEPTPAPPRALPAYTDPATRRVKTSRAHEERVATDYGGRRLKASGALPFSRRDHNTAGADVSTDLLLIQHKGTVQDSLAIKREWLYEVTVEAQRRSKHPALVFTFDAETRVENEWVAVPRKVFQMLLANQPGKDGAP